MVERIGEAIVASMESGFVSQELLTPLSQKSNPYIQRESVVLGDMAALRSVFNSYHPETQDRFRKGLVEAMKKWSNGEIEAGIYEDLIWLASDTGTLEALPLIIDTIESKELDLDNEDLEDVMRASIGAFMGLNRFVDQQTHQKNVDRMRRWFNDPYYIRFSGSLMNGICRLNPNDFPNLFPKFLTIAESNPEDFIIDACIKEAISVVTPDKMKQLLGMLPEEERELIQALLER